MRTQMVYWILDCLFDCVRDFGGWGAGRVTERISGEFDKVPRFVWGTAGRCGVRLEVRGDL